MSDTSSSSSTSSPSPSTAPSSVPSPELRKLTLTDVISEEDQAEAARIKKEANKAFTSHDFPTAARLYTEAIERNPRDPTLWCNRAYTRMKLEEFGYALSDASQAIDLDPAYAKAYYRRATCFIQIMKPQSAVPDFKKVLALEPNNESVRAQLTSTQKLIRRIEFEKAIELDEEQSPVDRCLEIITEGGCDLEKTYTGPKLVFEDGKYSITLEFVRDMIQWFKEGKTLPKRYVWEIVLGAHEQFKKEESLVDIKLEEGMTCDVIGDVHGQFYDMLRLYSLTGEPSDKHLLLMNGDLVDRGSWSIEVILTAFAFKWLYPRSMYINRGNHETKDMNRTYGFEGEAKHKHGEQTYKLFAHVFTTLPLATLISATKPPSGSEKPPPILSSAGLKRYFVVHGGLFSKDDVTLEDIRKLDRVGRQPGQEGLMCELLWTDPQSMPGRGPSKRGVGISFGPDVTRRWCTLNGVTGIIRSHEVRQAGYEVEHDGLCTTVFSAPNYVDQAGNKGAYIRIDAAGNQHQVQLGSLSELRNTPSFVLCNITNPTLCRTTTYRNGQDQVETVRILRERRRRVIFIISCAKEPNITLPLCEELTQDIIQKTVDNAKLSQYASGKVKKSRREKEQEAAELKKKEEEANAAKAYAEFLHAFEGDDGDSRKSGSAFVKSSSESKMVYAPSIHGSSKLDVAPAFRQPSPPVPSAPKPKGKRAMDAFLEEIKRDQAEREARYARHAKDGKSVTALAAYEGQSGSKDRGDPQTSNVFVANLPANVTETSLGQFFAKYGPVGSVKVMWPRTDNTLGPGADMTASRRSKNAGLSGFVSFMKRKDAEVALRELDGFEWGGSVLRVGWSKAIPLAAKPMFVSDEHKSRRRSRSISTESRSRSRSRSHSRDRKRSHSRSPKRSKYHRSRSRSRSWDRRRSPSRSPDAYHSYNRSRRYNSHSRSPRQRRSRSRDRPTEEEGVTDTFIRAVAAEVKSQDAKYEDKLREREQGNPKYAFMVHRNHRRHVFYRGLIESNKTLPPEFDDDGYNSVYSTDSAEESERERCRKTVLGKLARKRFEAMLRALSGKRGEIARCMTFCLEHAEAAHEVADIIVASLLVDGTAVPRKVARLHLICDILHNSAASVPSAWKFRQEFQARLGIVFDHLATIYHSFPGRITAETFKKQITAVVDIWEDWIVFPPDFTSELRIRLDGAPSEPERRAEAAQEVTDKPSDSTFTSKFKSTSFQSTSSIAAEQKGDTTMTDVDGVPLEDDVDGVPVDDDVDGIPVDDIDGEPVDTNIDGELIDGEPLDGEPIDGEPMAPVRSAEDDLDGEPMDESDGD
ncbi:hypothetical protein AX16_005249 [Volvariella volvacea WC 439]|nr:hypothetical protein AX16_005249 [Volvariella volvacea WC 439]